MTEQPTNEAAGTVVEHRAYSVFVIEALLDAGGGPRWSIVSVYAYTDSRNPGPKLWFNTMGYNCDVTQVPSRVHSRDGRSPFHLWQRFGDTFAFTDADAAKACAARLRRYGCWADAWEGSEAWRLPKRKERAPVRVVEIVHSERRTVVEASPKVPVVKVADAIRNAARAILEERTTA